MHPSTYALALRYAAALCLGVYLVRQVKKPDRFAGRFFAWLMNGSHGPLTDWAFTHLEIPEGATAMDVGCGGGRTINKLAAKAAQVYGIDYAAGSVAASRAHNTRLIAEGRVHVEQGSVSQLPFADDKFDLVTAIETQYYWPNLQGDMKEILRVLKPGGRLMVVAENYRGARNDAVLGPVMKLLGSSRLSIDDHRALFLAAGYEAVEIAEERRRGGYARLAPSQPHSMRLIEPVHDPPRSGGFRRTRPRIDVCRTMGNLYSVGTIRPWRSGGFDSLVIWNHPTIHSRWFDPFAHAEP